MPVVLVVVVLVVLLAVVLVVVGMRNPQAQYDRILQDRLDEFSQSGQSFDLETLEMSAPFTERVVYPIARKLGELTMKFTPQNWLTSISRKLELSGATKTDPTMFLARQFVAAIAFGGGTFLLLNLAATSMTGGMIFLYSILMTILGFFFPQYSLSRKITNRQKSVRRSLPDALDLLTICVEAGLGFDAAMAKVAQKWDSQLSAAFARVLQEIQLGKLRREALRSMAENIEVTELTSFVAAVVQSEQLGVSMARVLRIQADQMRVKRRQLAEEEAHKAPIKMLIPMVFLIFPSLLIVLLAPAALQIIQSGIFGGL
jgi:tight adherence protein C